MPDNVLATIRDYFQLSSGDFARMWKELTPTDKAQLKSGITDGSYTY